MKISRRDVIKASAAASAALAIPSAMWAQQSATDMRAVRLVMEDLRVFDPMFTTATITLNHGLAVYDSLFARDLSGRPQPQMVGRWRVSDNKKTYTFELRDGLAWHDGTRVTAADCVASIRRWGQVNRGGQLILARTADMSTKDEKTFMIVLKEPLGLLIDILADLESPSLFIMRQQDAKLPASERVSANIGSGPFKFNSALAKPGASFTYDRNESYVPRDEPASGLAGGKIVKVDRVIWEIIGDPQTAFAALQAAEVDLIQSASPDLLPQIESDPNLELQVLNRGGRVFFIRMNCLQKPFSNVKIRQALLALVDQEAFLRIMAPDPRYGQAVTSMFGNDSLYSNDENTEWHRKGGDPEKAKHLLKEGGYGGEKVVILQATNVPGGDTVPPLLAGMLRKIGVNAELASMSWGEVVARRANKGPVESGGWSIFMSAYSQSSLNNPVTNVFLSENGEKGWYGWPQNEEYEAIRARWADVETLDKRKAMGRNMQRLWWNDVGGGVFIGQITTPLARRKTLTGLLETSEESLPMWNMRKA